MKKNKVFVFSNLATSLDGKIATSSRAFFMLGSPEDRRQMQRLRSKSKVIVMGGSTLRTFKRPCTVLGVQTQPINAIVSRKLDGIDPEWPFFKSPSIKRVLFITQKISSKKVRPFLSTCQVVYLDPNQPCAPQIIEHFVLQGLSQILVEGGGGLMWDFASQNLIDQYNVTITPRILGGTESPTLVDGPGFDPEKVLNLRLKSVKKIKDELYLVYQKTKKRG